MRVQTVHCMHRADKRVGLCGYNLSMLYTVRRQHSTFYTTMALYCRGSHVWCCYTLFR